MYDVCMYILYVLAVCSILIGMYHDSIVVLHDHLIMSVLLCTYITYCIISQFVILHI